MTEVVNDRDETMKEIKRTEEEGNFAGMIEIKKLEP